MPPQYSPGSLVRVKHGIRDPNFSDIPLGGWAGIVLEVDSSTRPPLYLIGWNVRTLEAMHPAYRVRCDREGLGEESMWLSDEDLEPDNGEPVPIEQPTVLVPRPLNLREEEDRIRALFGLTSDDPLPVVNEENLRRYRAHLAQRLSFPFAATIEQEEGPFQSAYFTVVVLRLLPPEEVSIDDGILVEVAKGHEQVVEALLDIEVPEEDRAYQLLSDYAYWVVNAESAGSEPISPEELLQAGSRVVPPGPGLSLSGLLLGGGLLCAAIGALVAAVVQCVDGGRLGVPIGAGVLGLLGLMAGSRYGRIFGAMNGIRSGGRFGVVFGLLLGMVVGTLLGALGVAAVGTILGGMAGSLLGWGLRSLEINAGRWPWGVLGCWAGGLVLAWHSNPALFQGAALFGAAAGALGGVLLALVFLLTLAFLFGGRQ